MSTTLDIQLVEGAARPESVEADVAITALRRTFSTALIIASAYPLTVGEALICATTEIPSMPSDRHS